MHRGEKIREEFIRNFENQKTEKQIELLEVKTPPQIQKEMQELREIQYS